MKTEAMKTSEAGSALHDEFDTLLVISHYYATRTASREIKTLDHLVAKLSTSLLRHTDIIPADKAFCEAGVDCRVSTILLKCKNCTLFTETNCYFKISIYL